MKEYFCGWYFKCQSDSRTIAVIPSVHRSGKKNSCFIQLITDEGTWNVRIPYEKYRQQKRGFHILAADNYFGVKGIRLHINEKDCCASGIVRFGDFSPIRYDIMGPFQYLPFMECRHSVLSMRHTVNGTLHINGVNYYFYDGAGYLEGDRGCSFPQKYAWTQCSFPGGSLMLSVADIPLGLFHFTGVIGVIQWQGREYRLATYLGAKVISIHDGEVVVRQGNITLTAKLIEKHAHPLLAPVNGVMSRTIHESASCRACYCFQKDSSVLFSFETPMASFEYEYPQ